MKCGSGGARLPRFDTGFHRGLPDFATAASAASLSVDPIGEARRAGYEQGLAEARDTAAHEAEAARHAAVRHTDTALAAARAEWCVLEADRLAASLDQAMQEIEAKLSAHVATILTPFIAAAMRERALEAFAGAIRQALGRGVRPGASPVRIEIAGPADCLDAFREKLGSLPASIAFLPGMGFEVTAEIDATRLSANLADWLGPLRNEAEP